MNELKIAPAGLMKQLMPGKYVDSVLVNIVDNCSDEKNIKYTIEMLDWSNTNDIILDSTGFQLLQQEEAGKSITFNSNAPIKITDQSINLAPIHVIKAASILKPRIVMALDRPINKDQGYRRTTCGIYEKAWF